MVQERKYGPDGKAEKDTDYDDHGNPKRGPARPPTTYQTKTSFSTNSPWWYVPAGIGLVVVGGVGTAILVADNATGIGVIDDPAIAITGGTAAQGFKLIFGY